MQPRRLPSGGHYKDARTPMAEDSGAKSKVGRRSTDGTRQGAAVGGGQHSRVCLSRAQSSSEWGWCMSEGGLPSALQEKNEQDFVEVTDRIQSALSQIRSNPKLKATQEILAQLASCSRGTLNNRRWPLEELKKIKTARKTSPRSTTDDSALASKTESRIDRYKQQLYDSREEVLLWKNRHDEVLKQLGQTRDVNRVLRTKLTTIEAELSSLRRPSREKIVEFPSRR